MNKGNSSSSTQRTCLGTLIALAGIVVSGIWMLNISCGIFEIPDNLPIVGNLDEAFFMIVLLSSLAYFGIEIPFFKNRYSALQAPKGSTDSRKNGNSTKN